MSPEGVLIVALISMLIGVILGVIISRPRYPFV
jgi:hypothetical protein